MRLLRILLSLALIIITSKDSFAFDDGDFQYWNTESASWKVANDWKASIEEEFKFGDGAGDFYYQHTDIGFTYSGFSDWLDIGLNYRGALEEKSGDWKYENRPHLNATLKTNLSNFKLSNRSRLEFRIRQSSEDKPRYRNKSTIKLPIKFSKWELQPYIADEIFIDFDSAELSRNRVYAGFGGTIAKNLKVEIYYLFQSSKSSGVWKDINVLGTKLKFSF